MSAAATSVTLVLSIDQLDAIHPNAVPCCAGSWGLFLGTCQRCSPKFFILTFLLQFLSLQIFSMSSQKRSKLSSNDNWQKCAPCQNWGTIIDHVPKSTNSEPCVLAQSLQTLSQLFLNLLSCSVDVSVPTKRSQIRPIPPPCTTGCPSSLFPASPFISCLYSPGTF